MDMPGEAIIMKGEEFKPLPAPISPALGLDIGRDMLLIIWPAERAMRCAEAIWGARAVAAKVHQARSTERN
jgi:hypothetical protein